MSSRNGKLNGKLNIKRNYFLGTGLQTLRMSDPKVIDFISPVSQCDQAMLWETGEGNVISWFQETVTAGLEVVFVGLHQIFL